MTHLQKITTRAKQIRKAHPKKIWTDCIKAAAKELKAGKPAPKKSVAKKRVAGLDKVVKRGIHTSVEYSRKAKAVAKKKPAKGKLFGVSSYTIGWGYLVPQKGKPTKKDVEKVNMILYGSKTFGSRILGETILFHAATIENVKQKLLKLQNKLGKRYYGYYSTDKQFGNASKEGDLKIGINKVKLTSLQKQNVILL